MFNPERRFFSISVRAIIIAAPILFSGCGQQTGGGQAEKKSVSKAAESELDAMKKAAEKGDAKAQHELGKRYADGNGVEKNDVTAFGWLEKSATAGNVEAMYLVGKSFGSGLGVPKDEEKSKQWIKKSAEGGHADGQFLHAKTFGSTGRQTLIYGVKNEQKENARQYLEWLEKAVKQNHLEAKYALGMTHLLGSFEDWDTNSEKKVIDGDSDKGFPLLKESADAGYWQAQWAMAVLYQSGFGKLKANKDESDKYWKALAEQTDPSIQNSIGNLYHQGNKQYYKAGKSKYQGRELDFDGTNKVAFEWFGKAAEKGDRHALNSLGTMYRDGVGVYKDDQKALEFFKKSAEKGHHAAMRELAFAYLEGRGTVKDYAEAHKWLLKGADEESAYEWADVHKARNALGALYEFGWGVEKDVVLSYAWYNVAASSGFAEAKQNLARVEKTIKPDELREAQAISREWKPGKVMLRAGVPQSGMSGMSGMSATAGKSLALASVGTGFFVSASGNVLTNNHVVDGCGEIRIPAENSSAKLVVADQANDLALVKLEVTERKAVQFPSSDDLKQGEEIFVFGFPLDGYLPSSGNITPGIISALAGPGNNSSLVQMTAPVQPGNSGGPLLNKKGKVVGVIVGKANAIKIAKVTGDIPQNINFAIAPRTVKSFLDGNRVEYQQRGDSFSFDKDSVEIAEEARKVSVKIECWR